MGGHELLPPHTASPRLWGPWTISIYVVGRIFLLTTSVYALSARETATVNERRSNESSKLLRDTKPLQWLKWISATDIVVVPRLREIVYTGHTYVNIPERYYLCSLHSRHNGLVVRHWQISRICKSSWPANQGVNRPNADWSVYPDGTTRHTYRGEISKVDKYMLNYRGGLLRAFAAWCTPR